MHEENEKILILKKIKSFFKNNKSNYKLFFCTYAKNIGFFFVHFFSRKPLKNFYGIKLILKDILYSSLYGKMKIFVPKNIIKNYESIIVTWGFKRNFSKDGSFNDEILNCSSKIIKKNLWFIIYMDNKLPNKVKENIVILIPFLKKKLNIYFFFKNLLKIIFLQKFYSFVFNLQLFSSFSIFADSSEKYFNKFLNKNLKFVFMPYEAQPFQNNFFLKTKKLSSKIKTIGYIHSPPEAFPVQSIYKNGSPDKIILNGKDQIYCYKKFLGWGNKEIVNLPSIRFKKKRIAKNYNKILLPYSISNQSDILNNLKYLYYKKNINIKKFKIQPHPLTKKTKVISDFVSKIYQIKKKQIYFSSKEKLSIFIGASGAVTEYLERGIDAIHISDNPTTDFYSSDLYPSIKVKKIKEDIYSYSLKKKGQLLNLGSSSDSLKKYLKIILN